MTGWVVRNFKGVAPRVQPLLLPENQAQTCSNVVLKHGSLVPLNSNSAVATLPKSGTMQTIHRFGQDVAADGQYWFHWASDINVVRGPVAADAQERTYWTGDGAPKVTDSSIALAGGTSYPMASYTLGVPAPSSAPVGVVGGTPTDATAIAETRVYVVTFVTAWTEEGCPSDASSSVDVKVGETVTLTLPSTPGGSYNFSSKRIYRSVPGSLGTPFLFVAEVSAATSSYVDSKLADALGEQLPSLDYEMPPSTLAGLVAMPGGILAGFNGKDLYFSEPFKPHAWPSVYSQTADFEIVGLGVFDTTLLVLTKGTPYLVQGSHPSSFTMVKAEIPQACVSKRSIANAGGGVVFASPDGLFLIGGGGSRNLTEDIMAQREWRLLSPSTVHGYVIDNLYVGFYGGTAGFVLDLATGDMATLDWYASAGFYDPIRDALFLVTGNNQLVKFNASSALAITWKSKPFYSPVPINLGAARVEATAYPVTFKAIATMNTSQEATNVVAVRPVLSANGAKLTYSVSVSNKLPFRLPDGFSSNEWEFEVSGYNEITSAGFAESMVELAHG